jgi:hypothetical protein
MFFLISAQNVVFLAAAVITCSNFFLQRLPSQSSYFRLPPARVDRVHVKIAAGALFLHYNNPVDSVDGAVQVVAVLFANEKHLCLVCRYLMHDMAVTALRVSAFGTMVFNEDDLFFVLLFLYGAFALPPKSTLGRRSDQFNSTQL